MVNLSFICGTVTSEPEFRYSEARMEDHNALFTMDLALEGKTYGPIKVICRYPLAELVANEVQKGSRVLVAGPLVRISLKVEEDVWWDEIMVTANILEVIG